MTVLPESLCCHWDCVVGCRLLRQRPSAYIDPVGGQRRLAWLLYLRRLGPLRRRRGHLWRFRCGVKIPWFGWLRRGAGLRRRLFCIVLKNANTHARLVRRRDFSVASTEQPQTFEVEDSEFLCLRRRGWRRCCCCCFCPSATSPLVWGGWVIAADFTPPCSGFSPEAGC